MALLLALLTASAAFAQGGLQFPVTALSRQEMVKHLLNRAAYGARDEEIRALSPPGKLEAWLERQLHPQKIADAKTEAKVRKLRLAQMSTKELLRRFPFSSTKNSSILGALSCQLTLQKMLLSSESERQLEQVMADFWFNHFSINGDRPHHLPSYERDVIHRYSFGRFQDLLTATAQHPSMLFYLDNWLNAKMNPTTTKADSLNLERSYFPNGINENYARELLELHTVGIASGFTQADVENVAHALTGWTIKKSESDPQFHFQKSWHAATPITVLGRTFPPETGMKQGLSLLSFLATHPDTAKHLSRKLCLQFEHDPPSPACIARISHSYLQSKGELRSVYRSLFTSPEFWNPASVRQRVKKPFEFAASTLRYLNSDISLSLEDACLLRKKMSESGEQPYACAFPTGYSSSNETWLHTGTVLGRSLSANFLVGFANTKATAQTREAMVLSVGSTEFLRR